MKKKHNILKKIGLFSITLLLVLIAWGGVNTETASSQQVESRISRLESEFYGVESRLNRIESQLNQVGRSGSPSAPPPSQINSGRNRSQLSRDQMFDRLATLVIELKQQVNKLEARVSKLEPRRSPRTNR